jgi:hypothetical protein
MSALFFDDKRFLVFVDPTYLEQQISDQWTAAGFEGAPAGIDNDGAMMRISRWAKDHDGEVHFTKKAGRRSPRRLYRIAFTDGDQAQLLKSLDREITQTIKDVGSRHV